MMNMHSMIDSNLTKDNVIEALSSAGLAVSGTNVRLIKLYSK